MAERGRLRAFLLVLPALTSLALAACSTGVPPSGKVFVVSNVPAPPPAQGESSGPGSGPRQGLSEAQVVQGFMRAMATGEPERALPWVVPDKAVQAQVRGWASERSVNVYNGEFQPQAPTDDRGQKVVGVRLQLSGSVEGRRWVPDSRQITLELRLAQVDGEWRVANPGAAPWIDDASFERLYGPVELFLVAADGLHLAPVQVFLRRPPPSTPQPVALSRRVEATLRELLAEPRGRLRHTLTSAIPHGTRLRRLSYADSQVTVDLSGEFARSAGGPARLRVGQVVWTVTRLIPTAGVRILVNGAPARAVASERLDASRLWRRTTAPLGELFTGLWPQDARSARKLAFSRNGELHAVDPAAAARPTLLPFDATGQKLAPAWSPNGDQLAFLLLGEGGERSLWIGTADGRSLRPTGVRGQLSPPTWTPDGSRLLVLRRRGGQVELLGVTPGAQGASKLRLARMPKGLQPTLLRVSPDGAFVLGVGVGAGRQARFGDGGLLFLGLLGPSGVVDWFPRPVAPGLGQVFSPVWVDSATVAFIGKTGNKDDLSKLWLMDADGWDPTPLLNLDPASENAIDIGDQLTVDPTGNRFVFVVQSRDGTSLWMVDRLGANLRQLTSPGANGFDNEPSFATR